MDPPTIPGIQLDAFLAVLEVQALSGLLDVLELVS